MEGDDVRVELDDMLKALGSEHIVEDKEIDGNEDKDKDLDEDKDKDNEDGSNLDEDSKDLDIDKDKDLDKDKDNDKDKYEPDDKDKIIEDLRVRLAEKEAIKKESKKESEEDPFADDLLTFETQDFIGEEDLDDIVRDKDMFNKLLNSVYSKGVTDARKLTSEKVLLSIPDIVRNNIEIVTNLKKMSEQFYESNKDLVPFKKVVATVFEEIAAENPDKTYNALMDLVGPETRKRLDLHNKVSEDKRSTNKDKTPRLPEKKNSQRSVLEKPETSSLQDELDAMNKVIRR